MYTFADSPILVVLLFDSLYSEVMRRGVVTVGVVDVFVSKSVVSVFGSLVAVVSEITVMSVTVVEVCKVVLAL